MVLDRDQPGTFFGDPAWGRPDAGSTSGETAQVRSVSSPLQRRQLGDSVTLRADVAIAELETRFRAMYPPTEPLYPRQRVQGEPFGQWLAGGFGRTFRRKPNEPQDTPDRLLWLKTVGDIARTAGRDIKRDVIRLLPPSWGRKSKSTP